MKWNHFLNWHSCAHIIDVIIKNSPSWTEGETAVSVMLCGLWETHLLICSCSSVGSHPFHMNLPRAVWLPFWWAGKCNRIASFCCRSHSFLRTVSPADIEGRRRRWWSSAPRAGSLSSCEGCSCISWRRHRDGSDQLGSEREETPVIYIFFANEKLLTTSQLSQSASQGFFPLPLPLFSNFLRKYSINIHFSWTWHIHTVNKAKWHHVVGQISVMAWEITSGGLQYKNIFSWNVDWTALFWINLGWIYQHFTSKLC